MAVEPAACWMAVGSSHYKTRTMRRAKDMKIKVNSEIGKLKAAMLHPPGKEITRLTPPNMKALLWDNIPWPERALEEHQNYVKQLKSEGPRFT